MSQLNPKQWEPIVVPLRSTEADRSPALLTRVVAQFDVMNQDRYRADVAPIPPATKRRTWCNIFAWDVTSALGCEIPHWIPNPKNPEGKDPLQPRRLELDAYKVQVWLEDEGPKHGWGRSDEKGARDHAAEGRPAVAVGIGHIVVLVPPKADASPFATYCAQAGAHNFGYGLLQAGFGLNFHPAFYIHA